MLKVSLVEDEIVMREGIKNNINWSEEGFEFAGEASDGELAYPMIQKVRPDILLTDIVEVNKYIGTKSMSGIQRISFSTHSTDNDCPIQILIVNLEDILLNRMIGDECQLNRLTHNQHLL